MVIIFVKLVDIKFLKYLPKTNKYFVFLETIIKDKKNKKNGK